MHMSPKAALAVERRAGEPGPPTVAAAAWLEAAGVSRFRPEWTEGDVPCAVHVWRGPSARSANTAYFFMEARRWHPTTVTAALLSADIPLLLGMTRRALWKNLSEPLDAFVVVALEHGGDFAQYALGDRFDELGDDQFRRALGTYRRAQQEGWPGWAEAGVQVLDLPKREEEE
jgi:hypothetical protein